MKYYSRVLGRMKHRTIDLSPLTELKSREQASATSLLLEHWFPRIPRFCLISLRFVGEDRQLVKPRWHGVKQEEEFGEETKRSLLTRRVSTRFMEPFLISSFSSWFHNGWLKEREKTCHSYDILTSAKYLWWFFLKWVEIYF